MSLKAEVIAEAKRLGFKLVGVTSPDPPPHYEVYESWLLAGRHGEMRYLSTERARRHRADIYQILPKCRSILILGIPYFKPIDTVLSIDESEINDLGYHGQIASYAWGDDYHDVIPRRLKKLVAFIETRVGGPVPNRWYTDTGPILERDLAQRAGLGWIGKNTFLINPGMGSYFLLAEILLGIDLEPDQPFAPDRCGTCTRCLEACPTHCILPDRTIDARLCISYLTIELKNSVPVDLRSQMGNWIFGCDICQQVCPWNQRFAPSQGDSAFIERVGIPRPDLVRELSLSPEEFNQKFRGNPVKRAKRRGYLRNVATALGNFRSDSAVLKLTEVLHKEPEALVRQHAAWALAQIGGQLARQALNSALVKEKDPKVKREILAAIGC
jgi:epoxyqueuosine reductase